VIDPNRSMCIWEDCDQQGIYCAGHAREFVQPQIDQLAAENARLREALEEAVALAQHHIPGYAYGDNEAACEMADRLRRIAALSPAPAKKENERG
jgi:hypothetical protein